MIYANPPKASAEFPALIRELRLLCAIHLFGWAFRLIPPATPEHDLFSNVTEQLQVLSRARRAALAKAEAQRQAK